jgi:PAS domain S-box-containing protein
MMNPNDTENVSSAQTGRSVANILLVDDEVRNLEVLESILTEPNYHLVRARTADEALMALIDGTFAVIVLDIQMPGTNGIELANLIKQRKRTQHIPIIFLTAYFQEDKDVLQGYEVGAVDYLTKPVDARILKSKIAVFVELFQKNRELTGLNAAMESEIAQRKNAEQALRVVNNELEVRVQERALKLIQTNEYLRLSNLAVKESEQRYRQLAAIVESSDEAIISKNLDGIIMSWNRGAEQLFGYSAQEIIGQLGTVLIPSDRWNEEPNILARARRSERIDRYETIRQCKDGRLIEVMLTISPVKDGDGKVIGVSKIVRDITQQKHAERELKRIHQEVVAASRAKDDFLAALSHELRTPLNPVLLLASEAAEDSTLAPEIRAQFATIRNNVELEARLIDDLLDITSIAREKLPLNLQPADIHAVLHNALDTVSAEITQKQIVLSLDLQAERPTVFGDAVRLQQVFWNVLKNAVKFTPETEKISIATRAENGEVAVTVTDTGIGMNAQEIERIFNAFAQGDHALNGRSHRFGGLGLGLSICKSLVALHAGSIQAASAGSGKGATFIIRLPLLKETHSEKTKIPQPVLPGDSKMALGDKRILLVEDHEPTRLALASLLTRRNYEVVSAASVAEARDHASKTKIDFLISDIGLPDGDGYSLMNELKKLYGLEGIALTGYGMEEDIARSHRAGFVTHLTKPIHVRALENALAAFTSQAPTKKRGLAPKVWTEDV